MKSDKLTIFIDFGGVLYEIDTRRTFAAFSTIADKPLENIDLSAFTIFSDYERGLVGTEEFRSSVRTQFALQCTDNEFDSAWNATLVRKFDDAETNIRFLKSLGRVFLLSNTNDLHVQHFAPKCDELFSMLDGLYYSHRIGLSKPDKQIFRYVIDDTKSAAENCIFVDDLAANVAAAEDSGIRSFVVQPGKLSEILHSVQLYAQR